MISACNLLVGFFVLKNPPAMPTTDKTKTPKTILQTIMKPNLLLIYLANFLVMCAFTGMEITLGVLGAEHYGLNAEYLGIILGVFGVVMIIVQGKVKNRVCEHITAEFG